MERGNGKGANGPVVPAKAGFVATPTGSFEGCRSITVDMLGTPPGAILTEVTFTCIAPAQQAGYATYPLNSNQIILDCNVAVLVAAGSAESGAAGGSSAAATAAGTPLLPTMTDVLRPVHNISGSPTTAATSMVTSRTDSPTTSIASASSSPHPTLQGAVVPRVVDGRELRLQLAPQPVDMLLKVTVKLAMPLSQEGMASLWIPAGSMRAPVPLRARARVACYQCWSLLADSSTETAQCAACATRNCEVKLTAATGKAQRESMGRWMEAECNTNDNLRLALVALPGEVLYETRIACSTRLPDFGTFTLTTEADGRPFLAKWLFYSDRGQPAPLRVLFEAEPGFTAEAARGTYRPLPPLAETQQANGHMLRRSPVAPPSPLPTSAWSSAAPLSSPSRTGAFAPDSSGQPSVAGAVPLAGEAGRVMLSLVACIVNQSCKSSCHSKAMQARHVADRLRQDLGLADGRSCHIGLLTVGQETAAMSDVLASTAWSDRPPVHASPVHHFAGGSLPRMPAPQPQLVPASRDSSWSTQLSFEGARSVSSAVGMGGSVVGGASNSPPSPHASADSGDMTVWPAMPHPAVTAPSSNSFGGDSESDIVWRAGDDELLSLAVGWSQDDQQDHSKAGGNGLILPPETAFRNMRLRE